MLLPFKEATLQIVKEILDPTAGVAGLVFLMSASDQSVKFLEDVEVDLLIELEKFLVLQAIAIPVYFVQESQELSEIVSVPRFMLEFMFACAAGFNSECHCRRQTSKWRQRRIPPASQKVRLFCKIAQSMCCAISGNAKPIKNAAVVNYEGWFSGASVRIHS